MESPRTIIVVGGENGNQSKLHTQLEPIKLEQNIGIAVTSIFHGEVFNINEENRVITYEIPAYDLDFGYGEGIGVIAAPQKRKQLQTLF